MSGRSPERSQWLEGKTYRIEHNPHCPKRYLVRFAGPGGYIRGDIGDVCGYGATLEEAVKKAREQLTEIAKGR